ncbi:Six-hairpin glycosidase-like protein [Aspergillus novoparasiticus]|uniref:Six-hairpin glycosidase-like protein n=1 Tax=Aspergillus novoparasiticus TaxID=986946 RepID=A0A5N6EV53_9EURO|nr:Six-hairpin glycosidase-like protein [Aspergillus novoparasiticus]
MPVHENTTISAKRALETWGNGTDSPKKPKTDGLSSKTTPSPLVKALYSESATAKLWNVASTALNNATPPTLYPEYTGADGVTYVYRTLDFWTSGFFPGSLYLLLERQILYPGFYDIPWRVNKKSPLPHKLQLQHLCQWWTANLHANAAKRDTHDLGFMIAPWAMKAWSLNRDPQAYNSLVLAAHSLASRFDERVQSLRSWDVCHTKRYSFTDPEKDFLVIIDNMLNLDLLFWAAKETGNASFHDIAVAHARTTAKYHIRSDNSTVHVVNYETDTGLPKSKFTHQGYSDESCWARGQAWGILGFMQTFDWTGEMEFLTTARTLADYFIRRLPDDGVPYWDFDAPVDSSCPRDTSAGMVAGCGMLLIYKALRGVDEDAAEFYLKSAVRILAGTVNGFTTPGDLRFEVGASDTVVPTYPDDLPEHERRQSGELRVTDSRSTQNGNGTSKKTPETILDGATINNYEFATRRWANHGLVYADYYFMLMGNMLLELGLVRGTRCAIYGEHVL